ncbi:MAG: SelB C-terminal domain-containing protein, partial [Actinomycetota bacterium]
VVAERGAVRAADLPVLAGTAAAEVPGAAAVGGWWVAREAAAALAAAVTDSLAAHHREHTLQPGMDRAEVRQALLAAGGRSLGPALERGLAAEVLAWLERGGTVAREGNTLRLATHRITLGEREEEAGRVVERVRSGEPTPPTVRDLQAAGFGRDLVEACVRTGRLVRVSDDVVLTPELAARAEEAAGVGAARPEGLTVSRFREDLGTTRKYALPILEWLDARRITRRDGDVRRPGGA